MNAKVLAVIAFVVAAVLAALLMRSREQLAIVRAEAAAAWATNAELAGQIALSESNKVAPAELERLRAAQADAIRLRGEVTRLKEDVSKAAATAARRTSPVAPPTPNAQDNPGESQEAEPVRNFTLQARGAVPPGASMTIGGWETRPGVHTFAVMTPVFDGTNVRVQTTWIEGPRDVVQALGDFGKAVSRGSRLLTPVEATAFLAALEGAENVKVISAPSITTTSGRQANVSMGTQVQGADGTMHHIGPSMDLLPSVSADGSIDLHATATVGVPKSEAPQR